MYSSIKTDFEVKNHLILCAWGEGNVYRWHILRKLKWYNLIFIAPVSSWSNILRREFPFWREYSFGVKILKSIATLPIHKQGGRDNTSNTRLPPDATLNLPQRIQLLYYQFEYFINGGTPKLLPRLFGIFNINLCIIFFRGLCAVL